MCMHIVCNKIYYFEEAIECSIESFNETYEFESISYHLFLILIAQSVL